MTAAPEVLYLCGDQLYDETATAWDARTLQPLVVPEPEAPLAHWHDCRMAEWPDLASVCPCTVGLRYIRRSRAEVAS
ncbi:hypothetical protein OG900_33645 [Streptomyces sp. NBC_00433]